jgi:tripartite-type tricarboxylate transporter receptor subunit TctC
MDRALLAAVLTLLAWNPAVAQAPTSFEGKTVTLMVGFAPGGGTDLSARTLAPFLTKYLPGNPAVVVSNVPGAEGMVAMNTFVQRTKPDGLTLVMGSANVSDPLQYRREQARYDPTKYNFVGGLGRGGTFLVIRTDAEKRLYDKSQPPVVMGTIGGVPRSGMQSTAWGIAYLGWNAKWVLGYHGTKELFLAMERGEIDMTASGNLSEVQGMLDAGKVKILTQSGQTKNGELQTRPEFGNAPVLASLVAPKITDPLEKQSFAYWTNLTSVDKWLALPPDTPAEIVKIYRNAFDKMVADPEFLAMGQKISEEIVPQPGDDVARTVKALGDIPAPAIEQIGVMLRKQGLDTK